MTTTASLRFENRRNHFRAGLRESRRNRSVRAGAAVMAIGN